MSLTSYNGYPASKDPAEMVRLYGLGALVAWARY
jgi:hypothetical protein